MMLLLATVLCTRGSSSSAAAADGHLGSNLCEREIAAASSRHGVPVEILYGVGLTETGRGDGLRPYALNIAGASVYDLGLREALARFRDARKQGIRSIDVGCMQINYRWHGAKFESVEAMFDPATNVDYSARFLKELYVKERNWTRAVARYHAGIGNKPAQKRYVCGVIKRLVAAGLGAATAQSRALCEPAAVQADGANGWRASVVRTSEK